MGFEIGDKVFWVSQAAGNSRRKEGEVVEVVPKNARPKSKLSAVGGKSRGHESYVVKAKAIGTLTEKTKTYWPIVALLQPLAPSDQSIEAVSAKVGAQSIVEAEDESIREELAKKDPPPLATNAEFIEKLEASGPGCPASASKMIIGVDMAAEGTEMSAVVYHAEKNGVLCVVSKEEYEAYVAKMPPTIQEHVDAEILANLEAKIMDMPADGFRARLDSGKPDGFEGLTEEEYNASLPKESE